MEEEIPEEALVSWAKEELTAEQLYYELNVGGIQNMTKLNEFAKDFEPASKTKNVADLKEVSTDIDLIDDEFEVTDKITKQLKKVKQKVILVNNEKYRVPSSVIGQLKVILEDNPNCKKFKVKKSGTTMDDTRYQVIPLM
jgi:hypothetical protein